MTTAVIRLTKAERRAVEASIWQAIAADPIRFLGATRTLDEHAPDGQDALRPFPVCPICGPDEARNTDVCVLGDIPHQVSVCRAHGREHKPYFAPITRSWQDNEINLFEKSRQIMISWWTVAIHVWLAMTRPGSLIAFQSQNLKKSCELLNRAEILYRSLPRELQRFGPLSDSPKATARKIEDEMTFLHEVDGYKVASRIMAIPNGPHHVRMFTFTAIFIDEASVWEKDEDFEESHAAALACIKGGGKLTEVGTVNTANTYFYRLCRGEVE